MNKHLRKSNWGWVGRHQGSGLSLTGGSPIIFSPHMDLDLHHNKSRYTRFYGSANPILPRMAVTSQQQMSDKKSNIILCSYSSLHIFFRRRPKPMSGVPNKSESTTWLAKAFVLYQPIAAISQPDWKQFQVLLLQDNVQKTSNLLSRPCAPESYHVDKVISSPQKRINLSQAAVADPYRGTERHRKCFRPETGQCFRSHEDQLKHFAALDYSAPFKFFLPTH